MPPHRTQLDIVSPFEASLFPRKGGGGGGGGHGGSGGGKGGGSSSGRSSSSSAGSSSKGAISFPYSGTGGSAFVASSASRGGGTAVVISGSSPFSGRLSGGGTRDQVYGTSRIGSGYPYGAYGSFYGGRPLPFGFYPLYLGPAYYGGDEYGPGANATRPGGELSTAVVRSSNTSITDPFYIMGDKSSVSVILASLVSQCGIANSTLTEAFPNGTLSNGTSDSLVPHPEQMVQYYRASSFALALSTYNNSAALAENAPASNNSAAPSILADTPLPQGLNPILLACLNSTIAANLPLIDNGSDKHGLTEVQIVQIVMGSIFGLFLLLILWTCCCKPRKSTTK